MTTQLGGCMVIIKDKKKLRLIAYLKYAWVIVAIIFASQSLLKSSEGIAFAVEAAKGIKIVYPNIPFLKATNMAPGDSVESSLVVRNEAEYDFSYNVNASTDNGLRDKLFNILDLTMKNNSGQILYKGKLKDIGSLELGVLAIGASTTCNFKIGFPAECGNEYQKLRTSIKFVFNAREHPLILDDGKIIWDPPLQKADCCVRRGTVMPISFHLVSNGEIDIQKRGIDLIISGFDGSGKVVRYIFSTVDGTLAWEEHGLSKPHYVLKFEAGKYPVEQDTFYTATVKYGEQVLGETRFKSGK